jgi:hypothetical protein
VPYELRKDPNAYNYFFKFSNKKKRSINDPERASIQLEEHIECVICMNQIQYEVDVDGIMVTKDA